MPDIIKLWLVARTPGHCCRMGKEQLRKARNSLKLSLAIESKTTKEKYFLETCCIISLSLKFTTFQRQYDRENRLHTMKINKENLPCLIDGKRHHLKGRT